MTEQLIASFVDGSGAVIEIIFDEKRVVMNAYDEKTRQRYLLTFTNCRSIRIGYSAEEEANADLCNLTDGIQELEGAQDGARVFRIGFADESLLEIHCASFSMEPVIGGPYDFQMAVVSTD